MFGGGAGFGGWVVIFCFLLLILPRWVAVDVGSMKIVGPGENFLPGFPSFAKHSVKVALGSF